MVDPGWLQSLDEAGYRLTRPIKTVVRVITQSERVLSPMEIFDQCRREHPGIGLVTIYRTLDKLEHLNLVERVHQTDGCHRILPSGYGHQHIILCTRCGYAEHFTGDDLDQLINTLSERSGFKINGHILQLHGECAECQAQIISEIGER